MSCFDEIKKRLFEKAKSLTETKEMIRPTGYPGQYIVKGNNLKQNYRVAHTKINMVNKTMGDRVAYIQKFNDGVTINLIIPQSLIRKEIDAENNKRLENENLPLDYSRSLLDQREFTDEEIEGNYYIEEGEIKALYTIDTSPIDEKMFNVHDYYIYKQKLLQNIQAKIKDLQNQKRNIRKKKDKNLSKAINKLIDLEDQLQTEIEQISDSKNVVDNVLSFHETDLKRVEDLIYSENLENFEEALKIIEFYELAADFTKERENPLFDENFIFDDKGYLTDNSIIKEFKEKLEEIRDKFTQYKSAINTQSEKSLLDFLSGHSKTQKFLSKAQKSVDNIINPHNLKDISYLDYAINNTSSNTFSKDASMTPQVMKNVLRDIQEENNIIVVDTDKKLTALQTLVEKKLARRGEKRRKLGLLTSISYDLFMQQTPNGNYTKRLVSKFSSSWFNNYHGMIKIHKNLIKKAKKSGKIEDFNKANAYRDEWLRKNAEILDITKLADIKEHFKDSAFKPLFNTKEKEVEEYTDKIKKILGKEYDKYIQNQIEQINDFNDWYDYKLNEFLLSVNKENLSELNDLERYRFDMIVLRQSPFDLAKVWNEGKKLKSGTKDVHSYMRYNTIIPKTHSTRLIPNISGTDYTVESTETGYYDEKFKEIEVDDAYYTMWKIFQKAINYINDSFDDAETSILANSLPALQRSFMENIMRSNNRTIGILLFDLPRAIANFFRQKFSISSVKRQEAKDKPEVNKHYDDQSVRRINNLKEIELAKLERMTGFSLSKGQIINIRDIKNPEAIQMLMDYVNAKPINGNKWKGLEQALGSEYVSVLQLVTEGVTNKVAMEQSMDLPKMIRTATKLASEYNARRQSLPIMLLLKKHYDEIKRKSTEDEDKEGSDVSVSKKKAFANLRQYINKFSKGTDIENARQNAVNRLQYWFDKNVKGNFDIQPYGVITGSKNIRAKYESSKWYKGLLRTLGTGKVYTGVEKEVLKDVNAEIEYLSNATKTEENEKRLQKLITSKENIGSNLALSAVIDSILEFILFKSLAWNLSSMVTNRIEGYFSNIIHDSWGTWWTAGNIHKANAFVSASIRRKLLKKSRNKEYQKFLILMDNTRIMQDASNELQKNSIKSGVKNIHKGNPFYLPITRVEMKNQGADVLAILMDKKIKDKHGNEVPIFDGRRFPAFEIRNEILRLKDEFRHDKKNIETWELFSSQDYRDFKSYTTEVISTIHGDFDKLGGMAVKKTVGGRALMMFKTWMPKQIWSRFAVEQDVLESEQVKFKGRFRSHTKASATMLGSVTGMMLFGPPGAAVLGGLGFFLGSRNNVKKDVGFAKELVILSLNIMKKMLFIPTNMIGLTNVKEGNLSKMGLKDKEDIGRIRANITEISIILGLISLKLFIKGLLWDDEPETDEEKQRRRRHNLLENKISELINNSTQYVNPEAMWENVSNLPVYRWFLNVKKLLIDFEKTMEGDDSVEGESRMRRILDKTIMPSILQEGIEGLPIGGLGKTEDRDYNPDEYTDRIFWGEEYRAKKLYTKERKKLKRKLIKYEDIPENEATYIMNKRYGKKKKNQTYVEMLEYYRSINKEYKK